MAQKAVVLKKKLNESKNFSYTQLSNDLKCLVIQDCNTVDVSLSLSIGVGHADDPMAYEGLSHLLEHMLFQGSRSYPEANALIAACELSGGRVEASTSAEIMQINCHVNIEAMSGIVDILTDIITSPLMQIESMVREMAIIEQEFAVKKNDDLARLSQVANHLTNERHPSQRFSTGNKQSFDKHCLTHWHQQILNLYEQNFLSDNISLCIISPLNVEQVKTNWLLPFQAVSQGTAKRERQSLLRFGPDYLGIAVDIQGVESTRHLLFSFAMPNILPHYQTKPLQLLTKLLNLDVSGSLTNYLKSQGWITALSAGFGQHGQDYCDFDIHLILTPDGSLNIDKIQHSVFSNLRFLQKVSKQAWRKDELKKEYKIAFEQSLDGNIGHLAAEFSANLFLFPPSDVVTANKLINRIEDDEEPWFQYLTANNLRRFHIAMDHQSKHIEPWYGTEFEVTKLVLGLTPETITDHDYLWQAPSPNPFLLNYGCSSNSTPIEDVEKKLVNISDYSVWHICSHKQTMDVSECYVGLFGDILIKTVSAKVSVDIIVHIINRRFTQRFANAINAGLKFRAYTSLSGLSLHFNGFTNGLSKLLIAVIDNVISVPISNHEYTVACSELQSKYTRQLASKPVYQLFNRLNKLMNPLAYDTNSKYLQLLQTTLQGVTRLQSTMFEKSNLNVLFAGHWNTETLSQLNHKIYQRTHRNDRAKTFSNDFLAIQNSADKHIALDKKYSDYALVNYLFSTSSNELITTYFMLAEQLFASAFFSAMRETSPLSYLCGNHYLPYGCYPGLVFYGQTKYSQRHDFKLALEHFIDSLSIVASGLTSETFFTVKKSLKEQLEKPAPDPSHDYKNFWTNLFLPPAMQRLDSKVLSKIDDVTLEQFQCFTDDLKNTENYKKIILFTDI